MRTPREKKTKLEQLMEMLDDEAITIIKNVRAVSQRQVEEEDYDGEFITLAERARVFDVISRHVNERGKRSGSATPAKGKFDGIRQRYNSATSDKT